MCKQVSRLGFILLWRLPIIIYDSDIMPFRQLHGYWVSPEISSAFPWHQLDASTFVHLHMLFILGKV